MKLDECGLPLYIAVKMFTPFIIGKLIERKIVYTPKQAEKLIKEENPISLKILEEVIKDKYVLLNRAPTLHRLSIEAFKIKLMPGKTIRLHPLVCASFNADFDGDQMAVHLPLSEEAQKEAKELIAADKNILKPSSGEPTITHHQDMTLGIYYITDSHTTKPNFAGIFTNYEQVKARYYSDEVHLRDQIKFMHEGEYIDTTIGRVLFNDLLPEKIRFKNETITKKGIKKILDEIYDNYDMDVVVKVADRLKDWGFKYATIAATTVNVFDMIVPPEKEEILKDGHTKANELYNFSFKGFISEDEKHRLIVRTWSDVVKKIEKLVKETYKPGNNAYTLVDSGARGTWGQMTQLSGIKGLVQSPSGEIIELPIQSSLVEGFSPIEYFIAAHGARKGKADTALRTAESGYLTRRLCDSSQEVIVREVDCGTKNYIAFSKDESELRNEPFKDLIFGRVLNADAIDHQGNTLLKSGEMLDKKNVKMLIDAGVPIVKVRSPMTCKVIS
ncbi:hypothetical protein KBC03_03275 [Patescibacteria group bacterium]|nr:hypothetical protein [Patescibacteria group bacterium]